MLFSIVIPVFNRPDELSEFLTSLREQTYDKPLELIIVEDGSSQSSESVVKNWKAPQNMRVLYHFKPNSGPGDSRNFGMAKASGDYFLLFDSDCVLPPDYLSHVEKQLESKWVDCFGGPDDAHADFTSLQKAITVSMTSVLTTAGVRGQSKRLSRFQPRSFNMGISKKAFLMTQGFSNIHPGEDPELVFKLWDKGFETDLFPEATVFHKRRISFSKYKTQIYKFGKVRPILDVRFPQYASIVYSFPVFFVVLFFLSLVMSFFGSHELFMVFSLYFFLIFLEGTLRFKSVYVGALAIITTLVQFSSYATGYILSTFLVKILKRNPEEVFPELFFKKP